MERPLARGHPLIPARSSLRVLHATPDGCSERHGDNPESLRLDRAGRQPAFGFIGPDPSGRAGFSVACDGTDVRALDIPVWLGSTTSVLPILTETAKPAFDPRLGTLRPTLLAGRASGTGSERNRVWDAYVLKPPDVSLRWPKVLRIGGFPQQQPVARGGVLWLDFERRSRRSWSAEDGTRARRWWWLPCGTSPSIL